MNLPPQQQAWLDAHIATGEEDDDLAWARPLVDEAGSDIERGDVMTLERHRARNAARLAALGA